MSYTPKIFANDKDYLAYLKTLDDKALEQEWWHGTRPKLVIAYMRMRRKIIK